MHPLFKVKLDGPNLKVPVLLVLDIWNVKPNYRKSLVRSLKNILMWSDVILGPSFKVKTRSNF